MRSNLGSIVCVLGFVFGCGQDHAASKLNTQRVYAETASGLNELERDLEGSLANPTPENVEAMVQTASLHYRNCSYASKQVSVILAWISLLDSPSRPLPEELAQDLVAEIGLYAKRFPPDLFKAGDLTRHVTLLFGGVEGSKEQIGKLADSFPFEADFLIVDGERANCVTRRDLWPCIDVDAREISRDTYLVHFGSSCTFHGTGLYRISSEGIVALARNFPSGPEELDKFHYY